ncbi:MAG: single-stranded-DNA-specific exonuclease RecJ [SAR86 cluster bacterium]|uniref:Single-stranded-DNA-specific exonuclease RecJ n=1 Tax=SAR86 cluster bacterium TaxID=2030880 RepID=A0A2A5AX21_9GAMM|nr:MAG: single-stranded-DNA-specific exonuclease RecJ [SAR86 cluster bacterium]
MTILVKRRVENTDLDLPESIHPLLRRIYRQRNIKNVSELQLGLEHLIPPQELKGIDTAVDLLFDALEQQKKVLIVADFDADGATSCTLALKALKSFGFNNVDYIVPNRFDYGYGLTPEIVELAKTKQPDLIVTVDNGISSIDGVKAAKAANIKTLITDHHLPGREQPDADAIVNPNQHGCNFPSKSIAGVGVIFYVMLALRAKLREVGWFSAQKIAEPNMGELLDLVALGTVADVVALDRNNRILVHEGLKRIRSGRTRPGINSLLQIAKRNPASLVASDLGFSVGPRLNAAGRLDDMSTGIECLLAEREGTAYKYALQLDSMNKSRKQIEGDMQEQALKYLQEFTLEQTELPAALSLYDPRWHQGVVGILASRVKEKFNRPVIAFAKANIDSPDSSELKGSGRSIKGFHIRDALDAIATKNPGLINKFGGHAMAAGLSLEENDLEAFTQAFQEHAASLLDDDLLQAKILSDGELESADFSMSIATELADAGPWGQEFPEPAFNGTFNVIQHRRVGENHLKLMLSPINARQQTMDAIAFNVSSNQWPGEHIKQIEIVYRMDINEFRGVRSLQLMVEHILGWQ